MQLRPKQYQTPISQVQIIQKNTVLLRLTGPRAIDAAAKPINPPLRELAFTEYAKS